MKGAPVSHHLTVAAAQITATADPSGNADLIDSQCARAAEAGAQIVVFPEASMARFGTTLADVAEPLDGRFADRVRAAAQRHDLLVVAGMFTPSSDGRVANTLLATGAGGEWSYDKIHLYDAFGSRESDTVAAGGQHVTFEALGTTIGLATCYDLRFADQFRTLGQAGAQLTLVPASWGEGPGKVEQWQVLTRARAMDGQTWLLACDQAWTAPQGATPLGVGCSVLVDPLGRVRAALGHEPGLLLGSVDLSIVPDIRGRVPIL